MRIENNKVGDQWLGDQSLLKFLSIQWLQSNNKRASINVALFQVAKPPFPIWL